MKQTIKSTCTLPGGFTCEHTIVVNDGSISIDDCAPLNLSELSDLLNEFYPGDYAGALQELMVCYNSLLSKSVHDGFTVNPEVIPEPECFELLMLLYHFLTNADRRN